MPAQSRPSSAPGLVSDESHSHAEYKRRCVDADETMLT